MLETNKNTIRTIPKPDNNPTSAKFSDCNQVRQSCRLLEEAAVEVGQTGHGQDNKRSAGTWLCLQCGKTLNVCDHKVIKYCERKKKTRIEKRKAVVAYHSISYDAKVSFYDSLETRALIWHGSTINFPLDDPGHMYLNLKCTVDTQHI